MRVLQKLTRGSVALSLACLFALANLAPLMAAQASPASAEMACCRNHRKACCRKPASTPTGPAFSSRPCAGDCAKVTLGGVAAIGLAPVAITPHSVLFSADEIALEAAPALSAATAFQLHQRPPPVRS
jgi:hypothetical protein